MKHYIISVWLRPSGVKPERPRRYVVTVWKGVDKRKHAVALALGVICGAERAPFMPFSWRSEKVRLVGDIKELGRSWLERDEFEVRKFEEVKAKFEPRR